MTPLQFENAYGSVWSELEAAIGRVLQRNGDSAKAADPVPAARAVALYRQTCEHLALARARSYPAHLVGRLERLTQDAHQAMYHRATWDLGQLRTLLNSTFPQAVRAHGAYVAVAAATFLLPALVLGVLVYRRPELILAVVNAETAASFDEMYSPSAEAIGRTASTDWMMFGVYIRNNIGVAFQCFAGGLFAGVGSLFFLAFNGAFGGAVAGYLTERGLGHTFYQFIVTHAAFELTAIVMIRTPTRDPFVSLGRFFTIWPALLVAVLLYGVMAMLLIAAAIEAFWSSARWMPLSLKYAVAAACWVSVVAYFLLQGRRAD